MPRFDARALTPAHDREHFKKHVLPHLFWLSVAGGAVCGFLMWISCYCLRRKSAGAPRRLRQRRRRKEDDDSFAPGIQLERFPELT